MNPAEVGPRTDECRLLDAMADELRLLGALRATLRRMDEASTRGDADAVDEAVYAAHRVRQTLTEAQRRRAALVEIGELRTGRQALRGDSVKAAVARLLECGLSLDGEIRNRCSALERTLAVTGPAAPAGVTAAAALSA